MSDQLNLEPALQTLTQIYPAVAKKFERDQLRESIAPLISKFAIDFPKEKLKVVQETIKTLFAEAHKPDYIQEKIRHYEARGQKKEVQILQHSINNFSILMAYDFHYEPVTGQLSLIEINTNASGFLFSDLVYQAHGTRFANPSSPKTPLDLLFESIKKEAELSGLQQLKKIAIIDASPEQQKMYLEFLLYQDFFERMGLDCQIINLNDSNYNLDFDFIYNRHTDFTFSENNSKKLNESYFNLSSAGAELSNHKKTKICISPHPKEYLLLAHKENLIDFERKKLSHTLIPTFIIDSTSDKNELWDQRKKLFFKPRTLFGGKATYKGSSISRKVFERLFDDSEIAYLAQEFRPPGEIEGFKFDLRFYAYQDELHLGIARVYQGQVTNFNTPGGGFAPLKLI